MKRIFPFLLLLIVLTVVTVLAVDTAKKTPNADRIAELTKAHGEIMSQINQAQDFINQKQIEAIRIVGAIEELQRQDAEAAKETKPVDSNSGTPEDKE